MKKILWIIVAAAVILRIFLFIFVEKSLWLDEAALALNILDKGYLELFSPLEYAQSAPPLFLCLTKVLVSIFGAGERALRFIPFLCSLGAVFGFYFLSREVFKNFDESKGGAACFALAAFSFGLPLLYNTIEFKSYMTDVLFTILTGLIWFKYLQKDGDLKRQIGFSLLLALFPLFSFGSIFPVCAVLVLSIFKKRKGFSLILFLGLLIEYLFIFSKINAGTRVYEYWIPYFINYNPIKAVFILIEIVKYYFYPSSLFLIGFISFIAGGFVLFKEDRKVFYFFFITITGALLASFFNFYPLYERLSLFLYPFFLIIILSPLYYLKDGTGRLKKCFLYFFYGIFIFSAVFYNFLNPNLYKREEIKPLVLKMQMEISPYDKIFIFKGAHLTWRYYRRSFDFKNETFVCPYNMTGKDCADKIESFCKGSKCFILYSSEVDTVQNVKLLKEIMTKLNGEALLKDKNALLYKI